MALDLSRSSAFAMRAAPRPKLFRPYELIAEEDESCRRQKEEAKLLDHHRHQQQQQLLAQQQAFLLHVGGGTCNTNGSHSFPTPFGFAPIWMHGRLFSGPRKPHRPLCGRYVRSGPAASQPVLVALRKKVLQRQQMKYWALVMRINQQQQQNKSGYCIASAVPNPHQLDCILPQPR